MIGNFLEGLAQAHAEIAAERAKTGSPAFPSVCQNDPGHPASAPGMTVRDVFALGALIGEVLRVRADEHVPRQMLAQDAYEVADAMLRVREGKL